MKQFIIVSCFSLAIIYSVHSWDMSTDRPKWRSNAMDFANDTRAWIRRMDTMENNFCTSFREHIVTSLEKNILVTFDLCDRYAFEWGDSIGFNCYFENEGRFHRKVEKTKEHRFCKPEKICSSFGTEAKKLMELSTQSCFYFGSRETLIELWSTCYFTELALDVLNSLNKQIFLTPNICKRTGSFIDDTHYRQIYNDVLNCEGKILKDMETDERLAEPDCLGGVNFNRTKQKVEDCYAGPKENLLAFKTKKEVECNFKSL